MKNNMRLVYNLIFVMSVILIGIMGSSMVAYGDTVIPASEFGDVDFYNYIIAEYDTNGNGQLEQSEAEAVTYICIQYDIEVDSIKGIEYFVNLQHLLIQSQYGLTDCSWLAQIKTLRYLQISSAKITDISFLSNHKWLRELRLLDIGTVADYSVINELTYLEQLDVRDNEISDISFINGLSNLEVLNASMNNISQLPSLSQFPHLVELDLYSNNISDFSEILNVKDTLMSLRIGCNQEIYPLVLSLEQIDFLRQMTNLRTLWIGDAGLEELPDLTGLTNLEFADFSMNYLTAEDVKNKIPATLTSQGDWELAVGLRNQRVKEDTGEIEYDITINADIPFDLQAEYGNDVIVEVDYRDDDDVMDMVAALDFPVDKYIDALLYEVYVYDADLGGMCKNAMSEIQLTMGGYSELSEIEEKYRFFYVNEDNQFTELTGNYENGNFVVTTSSVGKIFVVISDANDTVAEIEDIRAGFDISMEGEFEDDVYVVAKKIQDTSLYKNEITELYKMFEYISDISLYDIAVYSKRTNQKVQPVGEVKVSLDLVGLAGDSYHVLRLEESGQWTEVESFVEDGKLHFYSDHFSIYSVIIESLLDKGNDRIKGEIEKNSEIDNNANDDKKFDLWVEAGSVVIIILAVFVYDKLRKRKRKNNEESFGTNT